MAHETSITARERLSFCLLAGGALAVRVWFIFAYRIDSDEPQHLHVAWAWSQGLVQYRDIFDNHLPLLHLLFAAPMAWMPESSAVFVAMRLAILPFAVGCSWLLFAFARPRFGPRVAAVAALLFSVMPPWLPKSVEFRNDTLWIFFWLAGLALLTRPRGAAFFLAGVAFGLSLLASIKGVPVLLAHLLAIACQGRTFDLRQAARIALGTALPLCVLAAFMLGAGAFDEMVYGTLLFNATTPVHAMRRVGGVVAFAFVAPAVTLFGRRRTTALSDTALHLAFFAVWYTALLVCFWPILTPRDFLPLTPLAALGLASRWPDGKTFALAAPVLGSIVASAIYARIWRTPEPTRQRFVDAAVRLTAPTDFLLDLKGDAIFRRRPVSYIYEDVGRALTANGTILDRGPAEIVARGCCAAMADSAHLPPRTRAFLNRHFIGSGPLRVCGTRVTGPLFFIAVPQTYAVLASDPGRVQIDGRPYRGPRFLAFGPHTLSGGGNARVTVLWWRAAEKEQH